MKKTIIICVTIFLSILTLCITMVICASYDRYANAPNETKVRVLDKKNGTIKTYKFDDTSDNRFFN